MLEDSIGVARTAYFKALNAASVASDGLLSDGRVADASVVLDLILTSLDLYKAQDVVLSLTKDKMGSDIRRTEQRVHDGLQALRQPGFVYTPEHVYKEMRKKDNEARRRKARQRVTNMGSAKIDRGSRSPNWMVKLAAELDAAHPRPTAEEIVDAIETEAQDHPDGPFEEIPDASTIRYWRKKKFWGAGISVR